MLFCKHITTITSAICNKAYLPISFPLTMTAILRILLLSVLVLYFSNNCHCKIVLPHKLRYLENMLNAEVVAKAAKIRQRMEANPNVQDREKGWPMLLAQYQAEDKNNINSIPKNNFGNLYNRRLPNF